MTTSYFAPVRALRIYLDRTASLAPLRHRLFESLRRPSRSLSKNAVSFFLRDVISAALRTSVVFPPPSPSTVTGLSPRFWIPPPGAPVRCSPPFTCATSNTNTMAFYLWVRARGSGSPHLFLTCSWGGGSPTPSLSPFPHGSFTCFSGWMLGLPIQWLSGVWGTPILFVFYSAILHFAPFVFIFIVLFHVPA